MHVMPIWPFVQAGSPYFMTKEDLKEVAPMWSTYAHKVRNDPMVSAPFFHGTLDSCQFATASSSAVQQQTSVLGRPVDHAVFKRLAHF